MSKVVIYTPTYWKSPGTQYRIDMLMESLKLRGIDASLIVDREGVLRALYQRLSSILLDKKEVWDFIGKLIGLKVLRYKPDYVILVHDVTACATEYLDKVGVKAIVSVEDLTARYVSSIRKNPSKASAVNNILCQCLEQAWRIITPSYTLSSHINLMCGVKSFTVPVGLKPYIDFIDAVNRQPPIKIAHTRWLKHQANYAELLRFIRATRDALFLVHNIGLATHIKEPNVIKYRFDRPKEAASYLSQAHYGLVVELSDHYTLTAFYYHMALLQPIIGRLSNRLQREAQAMELPIYSTIPSDYERELKILTDIRERYKIPVVHGELLKWL